MTITETPQCACPVCAALLSAATEMGNNRPKPDSVAVCFRCGGLLIFKADLTVREATEDEAWQILASPIGIQIAVAQERIRTEKR